MEAFISIAAAAAALGSGLVAGTFFIFSAAIMGALERLPSADGMRAMQSINLVIINRVFLGVFLGTGLLSAIIAILGFLRAAEPGWPFLIAGSAVYLVGSILVTIFLNVPLNNALAAARPGTPEAEAVWQNYLRTWTYWNHVRTLASVLAALSFIVGFSSIGR